MALLFGSISSICERALLNWRLQAALGVLAMTSVSLITWKVNFNSPKSVSLSDAPFTGREIPDRERSGMVRNR